MKTIRVVSHVERDGLVKVHLPEHFGEEVEITLTYKPVQIEKKRQWSQKFIDLQGTWQGEPLERGEQGTYPERDSLL